ncbi:MAG: M23 family metallopeptidase [Treponema sp.]|nr:M23 family metallopeptidase [Treponema sp.]MBR4387261.1 M23 family metallopeptidase [Treponema sp.]
MVFSKKRFSSSPSKLSYYSKVFITCSASIVCTAGIVIGSTLAVLHVNNTNGQGGGSDPKLSMIMSEADSFGKLTGSDMEADSQALGLAALMGEDHDVEAKTPNAEENESTTLTYTSYRVKKGDMISLIAGAYNVTTDTIYSANNTITNSRLIQPGQYIKIPSMSGILYTTKKENETPATIAEKYSVDAERCALVNNLDQNAQLKMGTTVFVPGAEMDWETKLEINGDLFKLPLHSYFYISSRWGWRPDPFGSGRRSYHGGIDMACPKGTPIYSAKAGRVVSTGYSNVYGNYVIVSHGQGYKTLYGHMTRILTSTGSFVDTTTKIGLVGSTGASTGPHLHFTVYKNGKSINPTNVVNFAKR